MDKEAEKVENLSEVIIELLKDKPLNEKKVILKNIGVALYNMHKDEIDKAINKQGSNICYVNKGVETLNII